MGIHERWDSSYCKFTKIGYQHVTAEEQSNIHKMLEQLQQDYAEFVKVRSPARIPIMIEMLESLWLNHPDMRLGQLLENVAGSKDRIWNMEDTEWYDRMEQIYKVGFK